MDHAQSRDWDQEGSPAEPSRFVKVNAYFFSYTDFHSVLSLSPRIAFHPLILILGIQSNLPKSRRFM